MAENAARRIVIERTRDGGWAVSDEGGYFATAYDEEQVIPYVRDLLYGPSTGPPEGSVRGYMERLLEAAKRTDEGG